MIDGYLYKFLYVVFEITIIILFILLIFSVIFYCINV